MHYCVAALTVHTVINGTHLIQMEHVIFDGITQRSRTELRVKAIHVIK